MKKLYDEEYEWTIEVTGFLRGDKTEGCRRNGEEKFSAPIVCPDGCVIFRMTARKLGGENFHTGGYWAPQQER